MGAFGQFGTSNSETPGLRVHPSSEHGWNQSQAEGARFWNIPTAFHSSFLIGLSRFMGEYISLFSVTLVRVFWRHCGLKQSVTPREESPPGDEQGRCRRWLCQLPEPEPSLEVAGIITTLWAPGLHTHGRGSKPDGLRTELRGAARGADRGQGTGAVPACRMGARRRGTQRPNAGAQGHAAVGARGGLTGGDAVSPTATCRRAVPGAQIKGYDTLRRV